MSTSVEEEVVEVVFGVLWRVGGPPRNPHEP